jgi:hypothetical protein
MFTLLGLNDWSQAAPSVDQARAAKAFSAGVASLRYVLPYFDVGGFSAYDLSHLIAGGAPNLQPEYHTIHEFLLHALTSITGDERLGCFEQLWLSEVGQGRL